MIAAVVFLFLPITTIVELNHPHAGESSRQEGKVSHAHNRLFDTERLPVLGLNTESYAVPDGC